MGKNLIIKGADFSANGIFAPLSPLWTDSKAWVARSSLVTFGTTATSSQFKASNKIALPGGATSLKYTRCIYTTSGGVSSGFGLVFWDNNGGALSGDEIPAGTRDVTEVEISIPSGAKSVSFTYFMSTDVEFSAIPQ